LKTFRAELHVHTVLSPCAQVEMIPPLIVQTAIAEGIQILAITDHNTTLNCPSVLKAANDYDLTVLPGIELQTKEEVHILCIFDNVLQSNEFQKIIDQNLPGIKNQPDFFGEQFIVDETGEFIRREDRLLLNSVDISINQATKIVNDIGGLFIPAHINRKAFGLLANLGFVPTDCQCDALEISKHLDHTIALDKFPQINGYPIVQNGDVHGLDEFIGANVFTLEAPTVTEIRKALMKQGGRSYNIIGKG
jgi:3',5'-nucleoside bisphosphate phosphatase